MHTYTFTLCWILLQQYYIFLWYHWPSSCGEGSNICNMQYWLGIYTASRLSDRSAETACCCLSSVMYGLTCVFVLHISSSWVFHHCTCFSVYAWTWQMDIISCFAAPLSKLCINSTDKHPSQHCQQTAPHTVVTVVVGWWIMDFLLNEECEKSLWGRVGLLYWSIVWLAPLTL